MNTSIFDGLTKRMDYDNFKEEVVIEGVWVPIEIIQDIAAIYIFDYKDIHNMESPEANELIINFEKKYGTPVLNWLRKVTNNDRQLVDTGIPTQKIDYRDTTQVFVSDFNNDKEITVKEAVDTLCKALSEDEGLFIAYQANIAMAFKDEYSRSPDPGKYKNQKKLHKIANDAAKNFLNSLINTSSGS